VEFYKKMYVFLSCSKGLSMYEGLYSHVFVRLNVTKIGLCTIEYTSIRYSCIVGHKVFVGTIRCISSRILPAFGNEYTRTVLAYAHTVEAYTYCA
jgi:hypothetical protein